MCINVILRRRRRRRRRTVDVVFARAPKCTPAVYGPVEIGRRKYIVRIRGSNPRIRSELRRRRRGAHAVSQENVNFLALRRTGAADVCTRVSSFSAVESFNGSERRIRDLVLKVDISRGFCFFSFFFFFSFSSENRFVKRNARVPLNVVRSRTSGQNPERGLTSLRHRTVRQRFPNCFSLNTDAPA